jgi:chemotaxis-related protein WspB
MLVVLLHVGAEVYGLPASSVLEIVPRMELCPIPLAPPWLSGMARLRGEIVPVVDLALRLAGRAASRNLGTRIAIVSHVVRGVSRTLGVMAERLTSTARVSLEGAFDSLALPDAPFLGEVVTDTDRLVQLVRPAFLVPPELDEVLYGGATP